MIESINPFAQRPVGYYQRLTNLAATDANNKHLNGSAT